MQRDTKPIVIDGISYIPSSALLSGIEKISFKDNRAFAVVDPQGEAPRVYSNNSELGFYFNDTRYLGIWEMTFNGESLIALAHEMRFGGNTVVFSMTNRDFIETGGGERVRRDTFLIRRSLSLCQDILYETVEIKNFDHIDHFIQIEQWAGGKFDDVFEVRGFPRAKRGRLLATEESTRDMERISTLQYIGLDGEIRRTFVHRFFDAEKVRVSPGIAGYFTRVLIPAKKGVLLKTIVSFDQLTDGKLFGIPYRDMPLAEKMKLLSRTTQLGELSSLSFESDNSILNRSIENAQTDINMLLTIEKCQLYPYAGIPWFSAPFGRDGIITAYQTLPWYPSIAQGVLDYVFATLGQKIDAFTDEQPGKVFHELRRGEMSKTKELPFIPYYGSVDSTPLSLILLYEYFRWTLDKDRLLQWWSFALRALAWMDKWGAPNEDGFLEYSKQSSSGLVNQGWKDSHDSIMHSNGQLAIAPIQLCEVQGYSFRARMGMSALARVLGDFELAHQLRTQALELKLRFIERFWDSQRQFIYLAIGKDQRPCEVRSSNMGHCLWSQILTQEQAKGVTQALMSDSMFSGHGIRTLANREVSYNPLSYHNGSIWPHDNSLIMEGFRLYGHLPELERLALALIGVLESSDDFRLPELYCGFRKRGNEPPIPYEVACKPQAWAAGSVFLMLKSMLGLSMELDQSYLVFNSPILTQKVNTLKIKSFVGRDWDVDLTIRRAQQGTYVDVNKNKGNVRVLTVK